MHVKVFKTIMKELNVMQRGNFMLFLGAHVIALSRDDIGPVSMILNAITSVEDHLNMTTKLLAKRETFESVKLILPFYFIFFSPISLFLLTLFTSREHHQDHPY